MANKEKRFEVVYKQSGGFTGPSLKILVDRKTGVQYLWAASGEGGSITALLNRDGTPAITPVSSYNLE